MASEDVELLCSVDEQRDTRELQDIACDYKVNTLDSTDVTSQ